MPRPQQTPELAITFLYYKDLAAAQRFYEDILGLTLAIDQGWAKIMAICPGAHIGLVDETRGMNRWQAEKCVQVCLRVPDVEAWYAYAQEIALPGLSKLFVNEALGIRAFVFADPEGYQIEIQTPLRPGA
ncbi:VOC family protein [Flavimaricola marinus]|uniref:Glyoxalase-like domain protein n=1 Tax=Flavimaricola marinus TaxID=1819565 RepID=A0A238LKK3_9RHOB|nr:VOC family protein [Flavimaricola marinus]SMY09915.1 Glyoxalase-like domain protein [Flavimaricola marinus]